MRLSPKNRYNGNRAPKIEKRVGWAFAGRCLALIPAAIAIFQELADKDVEALCNGANAQPDRRRGLAFAVSRVNVDVAFPPPG